MSRVLVIGARGAAGRAVLAAFGAAGWETLAGGRGPEAEVHVDLEQPDTLAEAMASVDLAVNTVPHPAMAAERHVLAHGGTLIDVADRDPAERGALRAVRSPAGLVVLNWGIVPGAASLLAAALGEREPAATAVELAVTFSATGTSGAAGGIFLHRELTRRARHRTTVVPFPAPVGPRRCLGFAEAQEGWLGVAAAGRRVDAYVCLSEPGLTAALLGLNRLGLSRRLPRRIFGIGRGRAARRATAEDFCVWVAVSRGGRRLAEAAIRGRGMYRSTGVAALLAAEQLRRRDRPLPRGCLDPAELFTLEAMKPAFAAHGIAMG